jgi:DNA-binding Xre family transcriptional regulator
MRKTDKNKKPITLKSVSQHVEELYKKSLGFRKAYDEEVMMLRIAYKIAQLRKERHITQSELARRIGTTQQTVSRLEDSNNAQVTIHTLARLAKALHAKLNIDLMPQ